MYATKRLKTPVVIPIYMDMRVDRLIEIMHKDAQEELSTEHSISARQHVTLKLLASRSDPVLTKIW